MKINKFNKHVFFHLKRYQNPIMADDNEEDAFAFADPPQLAPCQPTASFVQSTTTQHKKRKQRNTPFNKNKKRAVQSTKQHLVRADEKRSNWHNAFDWQAAVRETENMKVRETLDFMQNTNKALLEHLAQHYNELEAKMDYTSFAELVGKLTTSLMLVAKTHPKSQTSQGQQTLRQIQNFGNYVFERFREFSVDALAFKNRDELKLNEHPAPIFVDCLFSAANSYWNQKDAMHKEADVWLDEISRRLESTMTILIKTKAYVPVCTRLSDPPATLERDHFEWADNGFGGILNRTAENNNKYSHLGIFAYMGSFHVQAGDRLCLQVLEWDKKTKNVTVSLPTEANKEYFGQYPTILSSTYLYESNPKPPKTMSEANVVFQFRNFKYKPYVLMIDRTFGPGELMNLPIAPLSRHAHENNLRDYSRWTRVQRAIQQALSDLANENNNNAAIALLVHFEIFYSYLSPLN